MKNEGMRQIVFLIVIAGRKKKDALLSALSESGTHLACTIYGKGTVNASYLESILGLVPEENKVVLTCMMLKEKAETVMDMLVNQFHFDKPNTGVAFSIPIDKLSF